MLEIGIKVCNNHTNAVKYPIEYNECPACGTQKVSKIMLQTSNQK